VTASLTLTDQVEALIVQGRLADALALTEPLANAANPPHAALATHATVLKGLQRHEEALRFNQQATRLYPTSGVAWHNLAATLGDMGRGAGSKAAAQEAFKRGLDVAETWSVYARALLSVGELDAAEEAYIQSLKRNRADVDLSAELANVIWMRRGDMASAQGALDGAFRAGAPAGILLTAKAKLLDAAGDQQAAAHLLAQGVERLPGDMPVLLAATHAAVETGALGAAQRFMAMALQQAPDRPEVLNQATIVQLAAGRADEALKTAKQGLAIEPDNQSLWGWAATAARALGDPLYEQICDYEQVVRTYQIETPAGWPSLEAYLADLAATLDRMHPFTLHPFHQSIRHGSQTMQPLLGSDDPAIRAFFQAIDKPIREHMAHLGQGADVLRRRNTGRYTLDGAWSVSLKPGGFHKDHFHPQGWLSSAFYVQTPDRALDAGDRQGWIRFGQPPLKLDPPLDAACYVRPQPGRLVLFPSYLWHGTEPFTTDEKRLTLAFDAVPA
jgi:uncharacterized protein (TIGR02466 family)